eukprot:1328122-Amphidinium_carterae.1
MKNVRPNLSQSASSLVSVGCQVAAHANHAQQTYRNDSTRIVKESQRKKEQMREDAIDAHTLTEYISTWLTKRGTNFVWDIRGSRGSGESLGQTVSLKSQDMLRKPGVAGLLGEKQRRENIGSVGEQLEA